MVDREQKQIDMGRKPTDRRLCARALWVCLILPVIGLEACQSGSASSDEDGSWRPAVLSGEATELPDPRAVVTRMTEFMAGHQQIAFEALVTYEAVQESGQKLHFDMLQRMAMRKPDKLFWITLHDDATADSAWFDAGLFRMIKQPANAWGEIRLPPTIPDAVDRLTQEYDLDVPFADLLAGDPAELWLGEGVTSVEYVGEAWVDGTWTDHVAIRKPGVDFEIWVRQGDEPFPMRFVVVFTEEEGLPSYSARFRKWTTAPPEGALPEFAPPSDGEQVEVVPVHER